jgi:adenine/guanine phosphoribosyltransferase-like PRPP-binding protein
MAGNSIGAAGRCRVPWPADFPHVIIHTDVKTRDTHPDYPAAKAGDADAALALAVDLISDDAVQALRDMLDDRHALLLPVVAEEATGFNAIPDAMAQVLAAKLNLPAVAGEIVQVNKVGHTRAPSFQRLVTPAAFDGRVEAGCDYVLVDDHVGLGGTLANLRGHVETHGASVIAMTTLTESRDANRISLRSETLAMLRARHGKPLDQLWESQFGYGIDCLTEVEAQNLCRQPSVAAIEDFLAQAAVEARRRGLEPAVESSG